jgi:membrane dipeptidase
LEEVMTAPIIVDAHQDIAWNRLALKRDLFESVVEKRSREGPHPAHGEGTALVGFPELVAANVRVVFATLYVAPERPDRAPFGKTYSSPEQAHDQAWEQLQYYVSLASDPRVTLIAKRADLEEVVMAPAYRLGLLLLMEGADPIVEPAQVADWYRAGVRIVGTSWSKTRYAGGTGAPGGLTSLGRDLLAQMEQVGMVLDVSHMAEQSFYEAIDLFHGPVIASHSNSRAFVDTDRQLTDDMIRKLVARNGVIGSVIYNRFLQAHWEKGMPKDAVGLEDVVRHIRHVCELAGDTLHAGIGTDFDGGFGTESVPRELESIADLPKLAKVLSKEWSPADAANILGENWIRFLRRVLPE